MNEVIWYGKEYAEWMDGVLIMLLLGVGSAILVTSPMLFDFDSGLEHTTHTPTFAELDGNCPMMKQWLEINPRAWYMDEKILRYNFICGK